MLRLLGRKKKRAFYDSMLGRKMGVLFEGAVKDQERFGFTDNYVRVAVPAGGTEENVIAEVEIAGAGEEHCRGVLPADRMAQ